MKRTFRTIVLVAVASSLGACWGWRERRSDDGQGREQRQGEQRHGGDDRRGDDDRREGGDQRH
jgi:hypothetical protein